MGKARNNRIKICSPLRIPSVPTQEGYSHAQIKGPSLYNVNHGFLHLH